jgi:hypothetical protein
VAYLLHTYENMSLLDAFQLVATRRRIWPNDGFCRHLVQLEKEKKKKKQTPQTSIESELERCTVDDKDTGGEILSTKP